MKSNFFYLLLIVSFISCSDDGFNQNQTCQCIIKTTDRSGEEIDMTATEQDKPPSENCSSLDYESTNSDTGTTEKQTCN